jgi:hypothetical protein
MVLWRSRRPTMKIRKGLAFIQIVCMVFLNVWNVRLAKADDSDIFGSNISPNVLILFDDSGSMDDKVPASGGYVASTTYTTPNTYSKDKVYRKFTKKTTASLPRNLAIRFMRIRSAT